MAIIKLRRDTYQRWYDVNPVLASGEPAFDITNNKLKVGNGTTNWRNLSYLTDATGSGSSDRLVNGNLNVTLNSDGALVFPAGSKHYDLGAGNSILSHNIEVDNNTWAFNAQGFISLPNGNVIDTGVANKFILETGGDTDLEIFTIGGGDTPNTYTWSFGRNGNLQFPGNDLGGQFQIVPAQNTYVTAATPTVIFTGTPYVETMKATIQVIDRSATAVGGISTYNTQLCEILVVKQRVYNANIDATSFTVEAMVYGVVHTSLTPMATFDAQWNALTNQIEITMVKDAAYTALEAKVMATESVNTAG